MVIDNGGPWTFQEVCEAFNAVASLGPSVIVIDGLDEIGATLGKTIRQVIYTLVVWDILKSPPSISLFIQPIFWSVFSQKLQNVPNSITSYIFWFAA